MLRDTYPHQLAGHCGSGSFRDLLQFHGLDYGNGPLSEGFAFGLGGGVGFLYVEVPGSPTPAYLVGRTGTLEEDLASVLGMGLTLRDTDDPDEGWANVAAQIDAGRPPMVWADIAELEYLRVKLTNTRHDIVVVDYDLDAGVAFIADNDREELQPCSLASLARARDSRGFPGPNHHRVFVYDWPSELPPARETVQRALAVTDANMRDGGERLGTLKGATGLAGVAAFADAYPRWPETFGDDLEQALGGLSLLIVKAGTGGALFRSLQAEFLLDAAQLLDDAALERAGHAYADCARLWVQLAATARAGDHLDGVALVEQLAIEEPAAADALSAARTRP